ncbi:pLS20_p028 family conjugation system transmembrane protein [Virgibacillus natechei]
MWQKGGTNALMDELKKLYEDLSAILDVSSGWLYDDLIRNIGWGIIQVLVWVNDWIEGVATTVVTIGGVYDNPAMQDFVETLQPYVFGLFVATLIVVGFQFMLNKIEKRNEVLMNVLIAVSVIVILPTLMDMMDDMLNEGVSALDDPGTLSDNVLKRNIADVMYYVDSDFNYANGRNEETIAGNENLLPHPPHPNTKDIGTTDYTYGNQLENPESIEVNEKLDVQKDEGWFSWTTEPWVQELEEKANDGGRGYDFLTQRLISTGDGGTRIVDLNENTVPATNLGQQSYYRYHVNWGITIATLAVTAFALVITTIKIGRAMFDLAFHQLFAMFTAATDLTGGQRLKKILVEIASTFAVIFVMMVLLRMFIIYAQWTNDMEQQIGIIGTILLLIAGAWALIDAPDIVQRLLGIDAGLRSGWQAMMGGYAAGRMIGAGGKMTAQAGGQALKTGGKIGGGAVAGGVGMTKAMKNNSHVKPMPPHRNAESSPRQEGQFSTNTMKGNTIPRYENNGENTVGKGQPTHEAQSSSIKPTQQQAQSASVRSDHSGGTASPVYEGKTQEPAGPVNVPTSPKMTNQPNSGRSDGHIHPKLKHTLFGGNRTVQRANHFMTRAHNTGYDAGQKMNQVRGSIGQRVDKKDIQKPKDMQKGLRDHEIRDSERD